MRYGLLGPLEVYEDDGTVPLPLGGPRQRAVLASLALRANETVSVGYVMDAAWEEPPASPGSNIRTYVNGLRRRLRDHGREPRLLVTRPPGYQLRTRTGEVDVEVFEDLAARGTLAAEGGALAAAAGHYGRALALWRGRPLEGLPLGPALQAEAARLVERRLAVAESYVGVLLAQGRPAEAVTVLRPLVAEYPLNESLAAYLMRALGRAGRRPEALEVYRQADRVLADELGVAPSGELTAVRRRLVDGPRTATVPAPRRAPGLVPASEPRDAAPVGAPRPVRGRAPAALATATATATASAPAPPTVATPVARRPAPAVRALPGDSAEFTGRRAERARVHAWVREAVGAREAATAPLVCVITGMPGVGKTRLAVRLAHEIARAGHAGDVQLFAHLRGHAPGRVPMDPATVLARFLRMLGVAPDRIPDSVEERAALYRDRLHGRAPLILLDDVTGAGQTDPLLPGDPASLVLVTSRRAGWAPAGARTVQLGPFTVEESVELLAAVVGAERVAAERAAAERIAALCGRLPLGVALAALRLRARPLWRLADFAARLEPEDARLDRLSAGGRSVRTAFDTSYRRLPPHRRRMLRCLAGAPAAALGGVRRPGEAEELLDQLLDECLVQQTPAGGYELHELLRLYARDLPPG
ncbi:BTAD domain-containing putative transcriptional regulator [Streptomyces sp. NPDC006307]|uniref:AfsR/SARP family transcriptional regulator n=1 Tax=Streptomyces sp. NPDC006307 TaxID=3156748 RepID=UPI0033A64D18